MLVLSQVVAGNSNGIGLVIPYLRAPELGFHCWNPLPDLVLIL